MWSQPRPEDRRVDLRILKLRVNLPWNVKYTNPPNASVPLMANSQGPFANLFINFPLGSSYFFPPSE